MRTLEGEILTLHHLGLLRGRCFRLIFLDKSVTECYDTRTFMRQAKNYKSYRVNAIDLNNGVISFLLNCDFDVIFN